MKQKYYNYLTEEQADTLIERYYEGATSCEEETQLRNFLSQSAISERYDAERAIFGYFSSVAEAKKPQRRLNMPSLLRWMATSAAAVLVLALITYLYVEQQSHTIAFINGIQTSDRKRIESLVNKSLDNMLSEYDIAEEQLNQFAEIDF